MKKGLIMMYFYAHWDGCTKYKNEFVRVCKDKNINYILVDVETEDGLRVSKKYNVKMCPRVVVIEDGKVINTLNGRSAYTMI